MSVLEAMALETPLVATDVGGTEELCVPDVHGIIVPPADVAALSAAMCNVAGDAAGRRRRADAARSRVVEDLSFSSRVRALDDIYEELAEYRR